MASHVRRSLENGSTAMIREPLRMDFVEGISPSMRSVEAVMREVAQSEVPVLLLAERGVGKKATARRVHDLSRRGRHTFRIISCAQLGPRRFENSDEPADFIGTGTVFLEELAELNGHGQACLLQALTKDNGNGNRAQGLARIICGSARDLEAEVKIGNL